MITADRIVKEVCANYKVEPEQLIVKTRKKAIVEARQLSSYLIKRLIKTTTLLEIGALFNQDHTTIIHSIQAVERYIKVDYDYADKLDQILYTLAYYMQPNVDILEQSDGYHIEVDTSNRKYVTLKQDGSFITLRRESIRALYLSTIEHKAAVA